MRLRGFVALVLMVGATGFAQSAKPAAPTGEITGHSDWPQVRTADADSVEHILAALYDVISGPAHQARDWQRFKSLFVPGARLIPVRGVPGTPDPHTAPARDVLFLSVDDYVARASGHMESDGFFEHGIHNEVEQFGGVVQILSTYESRHAAGDAKPFARGINSIQLLKDGGRYWIVDVYWDAEGPDQALPAKYLPTAGLAAGGALNQYFTGDWTGTLEYRDFQSNERVFLPTWLEMTPGADARSVTLAYLYDDGPTKTVLEESTLAFGTDGKTATVTSNRDHTSESYALSGLEEFSKLNRGTLKLTGVGKENDKPVDVRITLSLKRNLYTYVKETRAAGEGEYKFRDGYTFTRADAPSF